MNGLPTVTRCDGRTSSWLEVADRRRRRDGKSATWRRRSDRYRGAVPCRAWNTRTASLKLMRSGAWSQWKLTRVSVRWSQWRRLAIDRAAALRTDWRRFSRLVGKPANVALPKSSFISTRLTIRVWKTDYGTDHRTLQHPDYDRDQAQKLISSSMSRHLSTRNNSSKSMHAFLSNLANRQTDKHGQKHL